MLIYFLLFNFTHHNYGLANDPDENRTFEELVEARNHKLLTYEATTKDGYIITIHRVIPKNVNLDTYTKTRKPVIAFHGIICQSTVFFYNSPDAESRDNFGFSMLRTGRYDIWVPNARGNGMSNRHVRLDPLQDEQYWAFSFEQIGLYDIPAFIDLVLKETGHKTVGYVGYSQGAGSLFALLSVQPEYGAKIKPFIAWAPAVYLKRAKTLIRPALKLTYSYMHKNSGEFSVTQTWFNDFSQIFCRRSLGSMVCAEFLQSVFGPSVSLNRTRLPVYTHFSPSPCSRWQVVHYVQMGDSGKFNRFDYHQKNIEIYGQSHPPEFPLHQIPKNQTIVLMYGRSDWFVDSADVVRLIFQLRFSGMPNIIDYAVPTFRWNHYDFLAGMRAGRYVYDKTIEYLDRYVQWP